MPLLLAWVALFAGWKRSYDLTHYGDDLGVGVFEDAEEFVDHFGVAPEEALPILHSFEVADDDDARKLKRLGD